MTGPDKRTALLSLAATCARGGYGLLDAVLTQIASYDLDDSKACGKWAGVIRKEILRREGERTTILARAADILEGVSP